MYKSVRSTCSHLAFFVCALAVACAGASVTVRKAEISKKSYDPDVEERSRVMHGLKLSLYRN